MATLPPYRDYRYETDKVGIRARVFGHPKAPVVVLLHGFPECWYAWRAVIPTLLGAGWRVVVPDLRGYETSDKPLAKDAYAPERIARDVVGVLDGVQAPRAPIVGHDVGGWAAWWTAALHPDRVERVVAINAPHPSVRPLRWPPPLVSGLNAALIGNALLDHLLPVQRCNVLANVLTRNSRQGAHTPEDLAVYREAWGREDAIKAMVTYFRAPQPAFPGRTATPARVIWGDKDPSAPVDLAQQSASQCEQADVVRIAEAGHFPHHDKPEQVADAILGHIGRHEVIRERTRPPQW